MKNSRDFHNLPCSELNMCHNVGVVYQSCWGINKYFLSKQTHAVCI